MALKRRLIAKILIEDTPLGHQAVKYRRFHDDRRVVGDPVSVLRTMADQTLDEFYICFLGRADPTLVRRMAEESMTPITVAGSITTMEQVDALIHGSCADKVVTRSDALGWGISQRYGSQAAVYPVDYTGRLEPVRVPEWAGEMILTSVDRDGTGVGFDLEAPRLECSVPVVIAGGCGRLKHVKDAFEAGAMAACVSSMFAFTDKSPIKLRSWLVSEGCEVRA